MISELEESLELSETQFRLINLDDERPLHVTSCSKSLSRGDDEISSSTESKDKLKHHHNRHQKKKATRDRHDSTEPELLLGLSYNGTTGRLHVFVIKGSQLKDMTSVNTTGSSSSSSSTSPPDTYVKMSLISSSGQEISRAKTSVQKRQPNPVFKEKFIFQVLNDDYILCDIM